MSRTHVSKQQATVSSQPSMRPSTTENTCFKAESYSVPPTRMRPKLNTNTDHNIPISKQEASVSSQQGIVPKLITSEGTKLPKFHVHQITKQSSTRSEMCLKSLQSKCKQKPSTSLGQEKPVHPWTKLVTDIFHFESASYPLIVDYTSRFPIVHKFSSVRGVHIANQSKVIFSEYGLPEALFSDNGQCYPS